MLRAAIQDVRTSPWHTPDVAANQDREGSGDWRSHGSRRLRVVGVTAIALGLTAMLASFPFIYGDPLPGQAVTDPPWFRPVAGASILLIVLGGGLLVALAILRSRSRHTKS